jgi:hypothetical protein
LAFGFDFAAGFGFGFAFVAVRFAVAAGFGLGFALGTVADFGPPGAPGFGAPTVLGPPDVVALARAGVVFAAGVAGVVGRATGSSLRSLSANFTPRVTASWPRPTAVSMICFGLIAIRTVVPGPGVY